MLSEPPAYAKNTPWRQYRKNPQTVYPRIRGEHLRIETYCCSIAGLSPHTRGTLFLQPIKTTSILRIRIRHRMLAPSLTPRTFRALLHILPNVAGLSRSASRPEFGSGPCYPADHSALFWSPRRFPEPWRCRSRNLPPSGA